MIKYSGIYESSTPPPSTKSLWVDGGVLKIYKNGSWRPVDDPKSKLTIDSILKAGSTNPVENKAIYSRFLGVDKTLLDYEKRLSEVDDFYGRMTDFIIGDNDDAALINIETTEQNSISLKYKTLDTVNGSKAERTKTIPAVRPTDGKAGVAGMDLVCNIPYFFDFYTTNFTTLLDGEEITKALVPMFQTGYENFDYIDTKSAALVGYNLFANPKAGDRILMGILSGGAPGTVVPLWATVISAQLIGGVYSVTVNYDGDTYIFAYDKKDEAAILKMPWTKVSPKRNIYSGDITSLTSDLPETEIKGFFTPVAYQKYGIVYPIKPQTGDLIEEVQGDDEPRFVTIIALRNEENPDEYTDIFIPGTGKDNRYIKIVLKNDLTSVQSSDSVLFENYRRYYDGEQLLALDTVKAETIENSILKAYTPGIEGLGPTTAQLPKVGDLIRMVDGTNIKDYVPVCEVISDDRGAQRTRWFYKGKLYEVIVNTALTLVPEDPKVIYDTNSGTLRDLYISAGAKYNEATGYYELNGLTDITEEEMRKIYLLYITNSSHSQHLVSWLSYPNDFRTNIAPRVYYVPNIQNSIGDNAVLEVLVLSVSALYIQSLVATAHGSFPKLRRVVGYWVYENNNPSNFNFSYGQPFGNCPLLEEIRMKRINKSHTFAVSPNLSKESVQYMIENANPPSGAAAGSIAITLHPTAYARLKDDADIVAALEAKGGIVTLVSA